MKNGQTRRDFLKTTALSVAAMGLPGICIGQKSLSRLGSAKRARTSGKLPNFVIIFLDDSGWADFKPFSTPAYETPNVEQLAKEGCCFHNFYVTQAICSASRASLLSGCYPGRTKVFGAHSPRARGFDESCGLMYSNDMWEFHPENPKYWGKYPLQFWDNGKVTIERVTKEHQPMLTTWYTEHAVDFISRNKDKPFFLYVPHSMPHVPLFCSKKFKGKSGAGMYGDVMMEIDWSVGEIMKALKANGVEDNTLVLFTSDNGPWVSYGNHGGKTPYREAKGTGFDGGTRSACIIKFPGRIKADTISKKTFCSIDILPTLAYLAGARLPENPIDGKNVSRHVGIAGKPGAKNPNEYYPFSTGRTFEGIISSDGRWKLHLPHKYRTLVEAGMDGMPGKYTQKGIELSLFDMKKDPYETTNVLEKYPEVVEKLKQHAERHRQKFYTKKEK